MSKYADDAYLVIPADNVHSCHSELSSIENWALNNNLKLNRAKSVEIVFVKPGSKRRLTEPSKVVLGFALYGNSVSRSTSMSFWPQALSHCSHYECFDITDDALQNGIPGNSDEQAELCFSSLVGGLPLQKTEVVWTHFFGDQ